MVLRHVFLSALVCTYVAAINLDPHPAGYDDITTRDDVQDHFMQTSLLLAHREYALEKEFAYWASYAGVGNDTGVLPRDNHTSIEPHESPRIHPPLLPLSVRDVLSFLLVALSLFLAAGGGIGGGGVLVPVFIIGLHFTTEKAVALSNLTIAGGALANLLCNVTRRHPNGHKPLIDWDLILVMEPMTICGAVFGGYLNKLLPVWFTSVMMSVMLMLMSQNLWAKAVALYKRENVQQSPQAQSDALDEPFLAHSAQRPSPNKHLVQSIMDDDAPLMLLESDRAAARQVIVSESKQVPFRKLAILVALFAWILLTDTSKGKVPCGGVRYWALVLSIVPVVMLLMSWFRGVLMHKAEVKARVGLVPEEGDIQWTTKSTVLYPAICSIAGLVAGLFGVGGGIVKGPLLLEMGVMPEVAAATSATMILFTTGSASIVYLAFGGIPWDYAGTLIVMGFGVTLVGQLLTYQIIHHLGRRSVIIFAMGSLLSLGCIIMWYESIVAVVQATHNGFFHVGHLC